MLKKHKFAKNTLILLIASLALAGCSTMPLPNAEFIRVIPFDPPEAASVELVSRKKRLYTAAETEAMVPYLTCLKPEGVQEIIKKGKMQCRKDDTSCSLKLDSVRDTIEALDSIADQVLKP